MSGAPATGRGAGRGGSTASSPPSWASVIDLAYFEFTWDTDFGEVSGVVAGHAFVAQLALIVMPIVMLGLVNFALSYSYLRLERKPAMKIGAAMGILTAPWVCCPSFLISLGG